MIENKMIENINEMLLKLSANEIKFLIEYIISYYNFIYCDNEEIIEIK